MQRAHKPQVVKGSDNVWHTIKEPAANFSVDTMCGIRMGEYEIMMIVPFCAYDAKIGPRCTDVRCNLPK